MAGVTQRVKAIYANNPRLLEKYTNEYLESMGDVLDGIKYDHGEMLYEDNERLPLYVAYIMYHPRPELPHL